MVNSWNNRAALAGPIVCELEGPRPILKICLIDSISKKMTVLLKLDFVKVLAEHALHLRDGDEGGTVHFLDDADDVHAVGTMRHNHQHLGGLAVVASLPFQEGGSAVQFAVDPFCNLMVLRRKDHKLERLLIAVNHKVRDEDVGEEDHNAIDEFDGVVDREVRRKHDEEVHIEATASVGDVTVLCQHQYDDVGATGIAAIIEGEPHAHTRQGSSDHRTHERVIGYYRRRENYLSYRHKAGHDGRTDQRVDAEAAAQNLPCNGNQNDVEDEGGDTHREARGKVDDGGDTADAAARHLVGKQEGRPPEGEDGQSERDEKVVPNYLKNFLRIHFQ